jgi:broad specificity phosphatase PhoE
MQNANRPARLVLVRHGESTANQYLNQIIRGEIFSYPPEFAKLRDWDIRLTPWGQEQSRKTGAHLEQKFGTFDAVFISPQTRAKETFEEMMSGYSDRSLSDRIRQTVRLDSRLREKDHGAINFMTREEVLRFFPHEHERRHREGKLLYRALGGESWYDVKDLRVGSFLNSVYRDFSGKSILAVSHSITIKCFRMKLERLDEKEMLDIIEKEPLDNCGVCVFESEEAGARLTLKEWNTLVYDPNSNSRE